jgi:glucose/arabinose dehydrogenase
VIGCAVAAAAAGVIASAGCGGGDSEPTTNPPTASDGGGGPPEPADGEGGVSLERVAIADEPVYVTQPPSGDPDHLYVVERCGRIMRVPIEGGRGSPFLDVADLITCEGTEQGVLSVAFAPDYERSGLLYVDYTDTEGDSRVVEYRRSADDPGTADSSTAREILKIDDFAENHNGGLLLFGPDDELYLGMGDGGGAGDPERTAQNPDSPLGKLLRLDPRRPGAYELAAIGLRNPWRFSFDPRTQSLWIGDVGQDSLEEIDAVRTDELGPDLNFGWSAFEGTERFNDDQQAPDAVAPVFDYPTSGDNCSVTGGYVIRDPDLPTLNGRYLYGDYCAGDLRSFTAVADEPAKDDTELGLEVPQLSSFGIDVEGRYYAVSLEGTVYRLVASGN